MDSSHLEKMGRELKCPICLSLLNSAVSLSCNHVFCNVCIQKSMKSASDCPVCKVPYRRREVRPAPHMDNLVNIYRSMEVASGVNIFVSQTVPSKKSSGVVNQSEADEVGDKAQMCSKTVDQVNRKKLKGNGLKGHTNRYSGSDAMKPSFPTKKRIQVPHHPVSEAPTQPTRLATVLSEETLYKVQSAVLKEDRPHIENKENKDFCPFFWLQDEEGDADKCTPHTVEDIAMDTPLGTPCFSDLKDSDNELQCKAMSPNIGPSMSHQEDVFDSEMFEWTQRACSPELYSSPKKLQVEQTDRHKEIEEKALAEDIAQRTEGEPYNGKGTNLEKCADIMVEDMTAYGNCTGNNARGTTREKRSKKARQGNQIKQVKPMETCNVLKDITEATVKKKRVDIVGSPHSSMYVKPKFQKRAKKACASSSAKATVPVNDSTLAKGIKSLDENCSFVVDLSTSLADKGGSNENKQNKQRKRTLESCLDQAELAQHNIQNRNHGKVSNLIKTSNMCKPKRSIKKVCRDGSAANMVTENGCSAMEGVEHMHVADEIMSAVNVYGSPNDNEDICRNQMLNSHITHIQQGRDHNRRSEPQHLNTASAAIVHQNITDPGSGDGKIGSGSMKDSKSCKKLNYTKNVKFVPADNPNDCQNFHAKINQSSGKISDESPNMNNVLPSKSGTLRKCGKRPDSIKCFFCHSAEDSEASGVMVHYLNGKPVKVDYTGVGNVIHVHRNCAEWAPNVYFEDEIAINLETELTRSKRIKCGCCGLKGAALGCYEKSCRKSFHVPCAKLTPQCRWDDENFVMLCPLHASSKLPNEISGFQSEQKEKYLSRQLPIHQPNLAARLDDTKSCKWNSHGLSAKLVLCCSGLTIAEKELVSEFEMQSGVKVLKNWDSCVTHVIASTDENGACRRTLKFLMGILEGKWILNIEWVKACLKANENVNEQQYEIDVDIHGIRDGPRQGRLRLLNKQPKLFGGYKFFFVGDFQPSYKGYLRDLLTAGGGTILHRKPISGDKEAASSTFIIYSLELPDKCSPSKGNLIVNNRRSDAENLANSCQAVVATNLWILNSIAACKLQILAE